MTLSARVVVGVAVAVVAATAAFLWLQGRNDYVAQPYAYARTADPNQVVLYVTVGLGDEIIAANVQETASTVTASVRVRQRYTDKPSLGVNVPHVVALNTPLGNRKVLNERGRELQERTLNIGRAASEDITS